MCYTWSKRDLSSVLGCDGQTTRLTPLQLSRKCASRRKRGFFATGATFDLGGFRQSYHIYLHYECNVDDRTNAGFVVVLNILKIYTTKV